jgi:hypothetical protein
MPLPTNNLAFGIEAIYALGPSGVVTEYVPFIEQYAGARAHAGGWCQPD